MISNQTLALYTLYTIFYQRKIYITMEKRADREKSGI